ncbi:stage V sporulation protein AC [Cellulosilyticum sp. I15G10I2]|uniref:stage V sporulation protein AC n=1 Tax=Cellulosilyticum sp. I15G10I2 TaxID=1892843 RepID=UPI00085CBBBE|nr:stage V sporulation protein AC [Cellulosilyticum sp. I15G10I2]
MANVKQLKSKYQDIVKQYSPKNDVLRNSLRAFWVGGVICTFGQGLTNLYMNYGMELEQAKMLTTVTLILISTILTAFNVYDNLGKYGGAGALIPITGFANSMVSAAMEFKKEGYIYGLGAKLFIIAGPVIVFGTLISVVIGIIYYFV